MKKHKSHASKQASASDSRAEVFVLPPELLAKLGISLNNIQHQEIEPPTTSVVKDTVQGVDHTIPNRLPETEDATSIIQTANLMKESVFLSPTFLQTTPLVIQDEEVSIIDESVVNTAVSGECDKMPHQCSKIYITANNDINSISDQCTPQLLNGSIVIKPNTEICIGEAINSIKNYGSVKEYQVENHNGSLILTDVPYQNTNNNKTVNDKSDATIIADEHPDEAYLSDCSNTYSGCSPERINSEFNKHLLSHNDKSKKVSELIVIDPQFKNVEEIDVTCSSSGALFTPVNTNSIVTLREGNSDLAVGVSILNESLNEKKESGYVASDIVSSEKISQQKAELVIITAENKRSKEPTLENSELVLNAEMNSRDIKTDKGDKKGIENTENKLNNNNTTDITIKDKKKRKSVTENFIETQDRVKEIAAYLSQIANERNNIYRNSNIVIEKEAKGDQIKSKLCIQGVEKPGGKLIRKDKSWNLSVSKTYKKAIIRKQIPRLTEMSELKTSDSFQITDSNYHKPIDETKVKALTRQNNFCICFDFGNFTYYDCEMLYEHIHFCSHKNTEYDSETLYSIYHEDYTMSKQSVDFIEDAHQKEHDGNTTIEDDLCWNEINALKTNEEKCELANQISQNSLPAKGGSSNIQITITDAVQEKSQVAIDQIKELKVKNIKCRVCKQIVSEKEWEVHKEKEHNSVVCETAQKLKAHSDIQSKPSMSANSEQKPKKKSTNSDLTSFNTTITNKSNDGDNNVSGSSAKLSKKSVDLAVKSSKPPNNTSKLANVVPTTSVMEVERMELSKHTRKSSSNNENLSTTPNKTNRSKKDQIVSANVSTNSNNEASIITKKQSKANNDSLGSKRKLSDTNKSPKLSKTKDNKTYIKPVRKTIDASVKTALEAPASTSNTHEETDIETIKPIKRSSNSVPVHPPVKKSKTSESSIIIEVFANDVSKMSPIEEKAINIKGTKDEKQIKFAKRHDKIVPSKVVNVDSTPQAQSTLPVESNDMTIEDSAISYDGTNITKEELTIIDVSVGVPIESSTVKCGVCEKTVEEWKWIEHISKEHSYIAWRDDEHAWDLEDEIEVKKHLQGLANANDGLKCSKCGLVRKFAKAFLRHIKNCDGDGKDHDASKNDEEYVPLLNTPRKCRDKAAALPVTCGVCDTTLEQSAWIEHIQLAHKYLAWTTEEQPLNLDCEEEIKEHLKYISKYYGGLICNNCGARWNYVKTYLNHISKCEGGAVTKISPRNDHKNDKLVLPPIVTCGVCKLDVEGQHWIKHIQVAHQYMAWIGGEEPLDPDDSEQVKRHLDLIVRAAGELVCMKCGEARRHTYAYLLHAAACARTRFHIEIDESPQHDKTKYVCAICRETGKLNEWSSHAMSKHYNIAWKVGDVPINLRNPYAVEKFLKVYKKKHGLICHHCKNTRSSCYGFYAHILTCGKTEEEIELMQDVCELCNNKYLCIYRNQHMAAHRDSDQRREKREMLAKKAEEDALNPPQPADPVLGGKRRAAEKAKKGIEKHSTNMVNGLPVCRCGATFKDAEELAQHDCTQKKTNDDDDSDVSVKMENESGESADEIIDSGVSDDEEEKSDKKKKRVRVGEGSMKVQRMPYRVNNYVGYLYKAYKDFVSLHYTAERLFDEWRDSEYQVVPAEEMEKYLPQVTESCKVRFGKQSTDEWTTYLRFQSKKIKGFSMFTGGATQCMSWAPPHPDDETLGSYLAVCAHAGPDVPRHAPADRPRHPASLQIWDFGLFDVLPKCSLCIAHEYGVVWAMDWCPSGARDATRGADPPESRLGLLAVACSNGSAYIFAVPCPPPSNNQLEPVMYKLKPVAELRLTMSTERQQYQATTIKWSPQKGHSTIIVGYSDGTTALYDLNTESPFLTAIEKGVTIFYPFQDRQSECSSVTGVGVCATANESYAVGGQYSTSATGGTLCGAGARPSARVHAAISGAQPAAHWPAVTLEGDLPFMRAVSEMEWWGGGRRVGAGRAWAACARCARVASAASPALRSHRHHHPAYPDMKKLIVALLVMVPLGQKRKRKVNDDLSVVVEPLTYEDAAAKYGLQLTFVTKSSRHEQSQAQQVCNDNELRPERFPLGDVVALAFCPASRFHDRIALATHTGLIFVINL